VPLNHSDFLAAIGEAAHCLAAEECPAFSMMTPERRKRLEKIFQLVLIRFDCWSAWLETKVWRLSQGEVSLRSITPGSRTDLEIVFFLLKKASGAEEIVSLTSFFPFFTFLTKD
jgi:hypothetical protein